MFLPSGECVYGGLVSVCLTLQSCHCTQWACGCGVPDDRKQTTRPRRLTFHMCEVKTSCVSWRLGARLSSHWRGQRGEPLCQFHMSASYFSAVLFFVRSLLNGNTYGAGLQGDSETNKGPLKGWVCFLFLSAGHWAGSLTNSNFPALSLLKIYSA